jgi:hemerythrin-like domain-containing protein
VGLGGGANEEAKVDVIANAVSYTNLLNRHIDKEDNVAYPFGRRQLSEDVLNRINDECSSFEKEAAVSGTQQKYKDLLDQLEHKYLK